jgi:predicted permease
MSWTSVVASRLHGLLAHKRMDRELDDEVRFHLEMQIDDNVRAGLTPADARNAALRSFGGVEPMKETYRDRRAFAAIEAIAQDIRYAVRTLRKSPGFTVASVAVLALAIGANTAMFSVLHAVLLRPLPYPSPEQLVTLWTEVPSQNLRQGRSAYWNIEEWRSRNRSFADIAFSDGMSAMLTSADRTEKINVLRMSPNLFALLGVQPLHGRTFTVEEAEQRQRLAVISHRFWQTHFGGSFDAIGASIHVDGLPSRIIGILPADFQFESQVFEPHTLFSEWESLRRARGSGFWSVMGRLRPGVSIEQAQFEMNVIARQLDDQLPAGSRNLGVSLLPLSEQQTGRGARLALWMLTGAVFCVLLIAVTNVASLSLARSASREREIAVRAALGASRGRIMRQLLAESLTLAAVAGALGLLVAHAGIRLILAMRPGNLARLDEVRLDPSVLAGALGLCLLTGILVGLAPAITMARRSLRPTGEGGRSIAGGVATRRTRQALVVTEFALAIMLLVGAGLLVRSLRSAESVDLGFRPGRTLMLALSTASKPAPQRSILYDTVLEQVGTLPGVEKAAVVSDIFIGGGPERLITAEGVGTAVERMRLRSDEASPEFFRTVGTPLLKGRFFTAADGHDPAARVAIINDAMARRLWPGADPTGKRFKPGGPESPALWFTVVGVVGDMRRQGIENEPIPQMFEPLAQNPSRLAVMLVRTSAEDPLKMAGVVQAAIWRVEKSVAVYGVNTLENRLGGFLAARRFQTTLLIGFSLAAMLMAAIGIYGLIQYSIATRTHEIGIRIAIGAQSGEIFRMILREGLKLCMTGLVLGLFGALWLGRAGSSLLFGVTATDPLTFLTVSVLLTVVALAACYFPARRAMRVDPIVALRQE